MQQETNGFTVCGTLMHTPVCGELEVLEDALLVVNGSGRINHLYQSDDSAYEEVKSAARQAGTLLELSKGQYLLPGLVDLHIHAPQWPQLGKALHLPLYDWLQQCTFPLEASYADPEYAKQVYSSLVETLIANGTTTALYFATIHLESSKILADVCYSKGQRGLVGKVAMDNPDQCPDFYRDASTKQGLDDTRSLIEYIRGMPGNENEQVLPVVTPRFIPSCTDEMLQGLGKIAAEYNCHIQTHCSESDWQHDYVIDRHGAHDTQSLKNFGLLTDKTILAHANLISDADMETIKIAQSSIAHCPLSNFYFSNAVFPARRALDRGLLVGLGTDISGGPSPSILRNCEIAVSTSRVLEEGVDPTSQAEQRGTPASRINFLESFWMATVGGAKSLGLKVGQFSEGYAFDAIVMDTTLPDSNLIVWPDSDTYEDVLQKIIYNADRRNISKVWIQGKIVKDNK